MFEDRELSHKLKMRL